ncbi:hypothetical protein AAEU32_00370 [Pseudoalteromonas sp. SSDWG2]|uniref:hypothetical protein n=1 Tax=Pseudoalteromonas sp. SSDWG2 TaxID=3139391 RepID=UPI003BAB134C
MIKFMGFLYILAIAAVAYLHVDRVIEGQKSPLDFNFILLLLIPFIIMVWKDAAVIKLGSKGLELEKLKRDVNQTIKHVAHGDVIDHKSLDNLYKSVDANDWLKLVLTRMLMRKGLAALVPEHEFGFSPSLSKLIPQCLAEGKILEEESLKLEKLRNITFYAEWWDGDVPTNEDWQWALENGQKIVQRLFDKQPIN